MLVLNVGFGKGGVAKTTLVLQTSLYLAEQKKKVLCVDFDGQEDLSNFFGKTEDSKHNYKNSSILFKNGIQKSDIPILPVSNWSCRNNKVSEYLYYCPAHLGAMADVNNSGNQKQIDNLRENIKLLADEFDYLIFDTPPTLGIVQMACLGVADNTIMPCVADFDTCGEKKVIQYMRVVNTIKKINPSLSTPVVVLCNVDAKGAEVSRYIKWARAFFGNSLVENYIEHSAAVSNANAQRRAAWYKASTGNDRSKGATFRRVVEQIIKRIK
jgi:chromosome partitioning protein